MLKKNYKGRCEKRTIGKCKDICRTYSPVQSAYANALQLNDTIREIQCNVPVELPEFGEYTTDFLCTKTDGSVLVRECVDRKLLVRPSTGRLLDASRRYWKAHGIEDWGIVINEEP